MEMDQEVLDLFHPHLYDLIKHLCRFYIHPSIIPMFLYFFLNLSCICIIYVCISFMFLYKLQLRFQALRCIGDLVMKNPHNLLILGSKLVGEEPHLEPAINATFRIILRTSTIQEFIAADYVLKRFCEVVS